MTRFSITLATSNYYSIMPLLSSYNDDDGMTVHIVRQARRYRIKDCDAVAAINGSITENKKKKWHVGTVHYHASSILMEEIKNIRSASF